MDLLQKSKKPSTRALDRLRWEHKILTESENNFNKHIRDIRTPGYGKSAEPKAGGPIQFALRTADKVAQEPQRALAKPDKFDALYKMLGLGLQKGTPPISRLAQREARKSFIDRDTHKAKFSIGSPDYKKMQKFLEERGAFDKKKGK